MADEMSSSAWVLMDDCDTCGGPPPTFHLPPPPVPPDLPCDLLDMACPSSLNPSDTEFKRIGSFPSVTVIVCCTLLSAVILLVVAVLVWRYLKQKKKRKAVTQTKDFDHHGPAMMNGNEVLYEDLNLTHARPRPPMITPSIEMLDVNHHTLNGSNGVGPNPKLDFSYLINSLPIYEELDHQNDHNNGSEEEFAEDELSVIDVPINGHEIDPNNLTASRYHTSSANKGNGSGLMKGRDGRAQSLTSRKRTSSRNGSTTNSGFKSQRSLDRRGRSGSNGVGNKYSGIGTNPRAYSRQMMTMGNNHSPGSMLLFSNQNGMTMKIPPHLVAVLTESALCNEGTRPYEVIPTNMGNGILVNGANGGVHPIIPGVYPSSRSSGSSYGDGSSSNSSARNNPGGGNSMESSSFDSGIGPHSITSFLNSPYDQGGNIMPPNYPLSAYEYAQGVGVPAQYLTSQHPSFRRLRMTAADRDHPLYSNHLLT